MLNEIRSANGVLFMPHYLFLPAEEPLSAALSVQSSAASGRHGVKANHIKKRSPEKSRLLRCTRQDSNLRPFGPEPNALSPELRVRKGCVSARFSILHGIVENVNSFPPISFRQKQLHFKQSLPKAAARFHRHTDEWCGQKKIYRSLPY